MSGQMDAPWFVVGRRFAGTRQAVEDARCANYIERTRILCFYSGKPAGDFTGKTISCGFGWYGWKNDFTNIDEGFGKSIEADDG